MSALTLAVVLSLVSAVAYAAGAIVQERVSLSSPEASYAPVRRPAWWGAVGLNGLGAALHVGALAFGPLSLVQPLGALTIVFALPMAALLVHRKAGATAWRGALMASVGLAGLLSLTGSGETGHPGGGALSVVALITAGAVITLMVAAHAVHRHPAVRGALLAGAAGGAFGIASVFTKTVADDWSASDPFAQLPSAGVIAVLACAGMLLSQASYRGAGLAAPLSTVTVVNPVVAAAVGLTLFGEHFRYGVTGTALALGCGVVAAGGLILLTTERIGDAAAPETTSEAETSSGTDAKAKTGPAQAPVTRSAAAAGASPADGSAAAATDTSGLLPRGRRSGRPWARGTHQDTTPGPATVTVPGARRGIPVTPLPENSTAALGAHRSPASAAASEADRQAAGAIGDTRQRAETTEGKDGGDASDAGGSTPSDRAPRPGPGTYTHSVRDCTRF